MHCGIFHGPKRVNTGSKRTKNTYLSILGGLGTTLGKISFFAPGTLVDPPLALTVRGPGCPMAPPSDQWHGGLGILLGGPEVWKPQKVRVCAWTRCPRNLVLSHIAQDTAYSWFWDKVTNVACNRGHFWPFLGRFLDILRSYRAAKGSLSQGSPWARGVYEPFPFVWPFARFE